MSLIIARIEGNNLGIVSDTKLTYPFHETKNFKTSPLDGVLKTIILNENLSISFAGEVEYAELALKEINECIQITTVIQVLEKFHNLSRGKTEFLICIGKPELRIYEIKNGEVNQTSMSWIGDKEAFNSFQESMLTTIVKSETIKTSPSATSNFRSNQPAITITEMNLTVEVSQKSPLLSKISSAMDKVIENGNIDSVGGFKVSVIYDKGFFYNCYIKSYRSNVSMIGYGTHYITHGTASDGSYSINFIGGSSDFKSVALHVSQGKFGIIYNRNDYGLLRPAVVSLDEVDFIDYIKEIFNITANFVTRDRVQKWFSMAANFFNKKEYAKAEEFFDKAFEVAKGVEKAKVLFNKGIILLKLNDKNPAMKAFTQTIKIDPSYSSKIMNILHPKA